MAVEMVSTKRNRVYVRQYDHEEARARRESGVSVAALAAEYGVSASAIYQVTTPGRRERLAETKRQWLKTTCTVCGGPAARSNRGTDPRCTKCAGATRITSVRDGELQCQTCREWKPDRDFPRDKTRAHRRGRHKQCSACSTEARTAYRERQKVPCVRCGAPRLPSTESGTRARGYTDTGLCRTCFGQTRRVT